jgi:hypothetical protein
MFLHFFTPEKQGVYVLLLGRNGKNVPIFVPINLAIFGVFWARVLGGCGLGGVLGVKKGGILDPPKDPPKTPLGAPRAPGLQDRIS